MLRVVCQTTDFLLYKNLHILVENTVIFVQSSLVHVLKLPGKLKYMDSRRLDDFSTILDDIEKKCGRHF